jgi:hypothetical protein
MQDQLLQQNTGIEILVVLKQSDALNYGNAAYWDFILKLVAGGSFKQID